MAGKISELAPQTAAAVVLTDDIEVRDIDDLTMAPTGTNKRWPLAEVIAFLYANGLDGRYVNVTGNEVVAGLKTFQNDLTIEDPLWLRDMSAPTQAAQAGMYFDSGECWIGQQTPAGTGTYTLTGIQGAEIAFEAPVGTERLRIAPTVITSTLPVVVPNGSANGHAVNKGQMDTADGLRVLKGGDTMTGALVLPADPTTGLEAATKQYVDNLVRGLAWKDACRVATTANITTSGLQTIDGVTVVNGDRVLVKNQSAAATNGILIASTGAWARSFDADSSSEIEGMACFVAEGTTQADTAWVCTANAPITTGSTALPFVQFAGTGGSVPPNRLINTTAPISGGGDLSVDRTLSLAAAGVTNAYLATMPTHTFKGNNTAGTAAPLDLTISQMQTELAVPALPVTVANGGSGRNTATTAYGLLAAGTTPTGAEQTVAPAASGFLKTTSTTALPAWAAIAQADVTNLVNDLSNKQPLDSDLSAIAILAHAANSMIQSNGSAWIAATPAQVKTGLAITKTDVGLGNVDNTSDANKLISTATQTALDAKQPLDTDLTAIAALAQASGSVVQSNGTAWIAATPAQQKTALALDQVNNTTDANKPVSTAQAAADLLRVLKAGDTMTGALTIDMAGNNQLIVKGTTQSDVRLQSSTGTAWGSVVATATTSDLMTHPAGSVVKLRPELTDVLTIAKTLITAATPIALPADPGSALHAATKQYVDTQRDTRVSELGDTMTGALYIQTALQASDALRVVQGQVTAGSTADFNLTGAGSVSVPAPASNAHATTKLYVDTQRDTRVAKAGDVMTGPLNLHGTTLVFKDAPGTTTYGTLSGDSFGVRVASDLIVNDEFVANGYANLNAGLSLSWGVNIYDGDVTFNSDGTEWGVYFKLAGVNEGGRLVHDNTNGMRLHGDYPGQPMHVKVRNAANSAHLGLTLTETVITSGVPIALPANPASALHAATKQYVDGLVGGGGGSPASETVAGIAEIATTAEVATGTDDTRIVSPLKLRQAVVPTWTGTQAAFDALATLDAVTIYYVTP